MREANVREGFFEKADFLVVAERLPLRPAHFSQCAFRTGMRRGEIEKLTRGSSGSEAPAACACRPALGHHVSANRGSARRPHLHLSSPLEACRGLSETLGERVPRPREVVYWSTGSRPAAGWPEESHARWKATARGEEDHRASRRRGLRARWDRHRGRSEGRGGAAYHVRRGTTARAPNPATWFTGAKALSRLESGQKTDNRGALGELHARQQPPKSLMRARSSAG